MTPEAVIFRYLEILRERPLDVTALQRLLCLDADLLGRWLGTFDSEASPEALQQVTASLDAFEIDVLAQSHAWTMLPTLDAARLAMDQWQLVCIASCLAEAIAAHLLQTGVRAASIADPRRVRMQILLAISGVNLRNDTALQELAEFRGTPVPLLMDAAPLPQIFAVVEALDTSGLEEAEALAQTLLGIDRTRFAALRTKAETRCSAELTALALADDDNIEWTERLWEQERVALLCRWLPADRQDAAALVRANARITRALFGASAQLLVAADDEHWQTLGDADIRIRRSSPVSDIAQAGREAASRTLYDSPELSVADRQILRHLGCSEAIVLPILDMDGDAAPTTTAVLVLAAEDESEPDFGMRAYASQLATWFRTDSPGATQEDMLGRFRTAEVQRLRELVHEANNPLSIVHNYLHILQLRLGDDTKAQEQLGMIGTELRRAADIIQRVKHVPEQAAPGEAAVPVSASDFDLNALVRTVCELASGAAQEADVEIERWLSLGELRVHSDPDIVTQVLTNLVKNAIEACEPGDTVSIATHAAVVRAGSPGVEITVQDSGPGLPAQVLQTLWEPKASSKGGDHQGIGLHLVFRLIDALEGHIDVRTSPETGTAFSVFLPRTVTSPRASG